ncbi:unnamed protein product [Urochloa humidicola]
MASVSCFHGEKGKRPPAPADDRSICNIIEESYKQAASRLPLHEIPWLESCVYAAGNCLGLAGDPISNIILNAVVLHLHDVRPCLKNHSWFSTPCGKESCAAAASQSYSGLQAFMAACFRYLSAAQARRYLSIASLDLSLAISLVHHDRRRFGHRLLPDGGNIKAAFRAAAARAEHAAPDILARTMAAQYPSAALAAVLAKLRRCSQQQPLTVHDVAEIKDLLARQWPPPTFSRSPVKMEFSCRPNGTTCARRGDGAILMSTYIGGEEGEFVARILIERCTMDEHHSFIPDLTLADMEAKLSHCLQEAALMAPPASAVAVDYDASPCAHAVSLKLSLLDAIHAMYIKVLAVMPKTTMSPRLLHAVLIGGHCYGPMDPVSSIIINSAWYDMAFPFAQQEGGGELPDGILDTRPMSRVASRSLDGLVAMLRHCNMSEHEALNYLSSVDCDLSRSGITNIPIASVAKAARHPQHAAFGSFLGSLSSLSPEKMQYLRNLLAAPSDNGGIFSGAHCWDQLTTILHSIGVQEEDKEASSSCCLSELALSRMPSNKSYFLHDLTFVRDRLNAVLHDYCNKHPWEPSYQVDIVCGVWQSRPPNESQSFYHANFLASTDAAAANTERTLFFAEFWVPTYTHSNPFHFISPQETRTPDVKPKPSICCPVYDYRAYNGRCSFCEKEAIKIIHPPSGCHYGYFDGTIDLYPEAVRNVLNVGFEGLLDSDFLYVDPDRDVELVKIINNNNFRNYGCDEYGFGLWSPSYS